MLRITDAVAQQGATVLTNPTALTTFKNAAGAVLLLSPGQRVGQGLYFQPSTFNNQQFLVRAAGLITLAVAASTVAFTLRQNSVAFVVAPASASLAVGSGSWYLEYELQWDSVSNTLVGLLQNGVIASAAGAGSLYAQVANSAVAAPANLSAISLDLQAILGTGNAGSNLTITEMSIAYM